jgi:hypothetical protein
MAQKLIRSVTAKSTTVPARLPKRWHAVAIVAKSTSCQAARDLRATRFLSAEAPRLPLVQCTTPNACPCAYKHHDDRRSESRREEEGSGLRTGGKVAVERRTQRDRREKES